MLTINNNLSFDNCPLCYSDNIRKSGDINYELPIYYSTEQIQVICQPELWKCDVCHSSFVQNAVTEDDAISLYNKGESGKRWFDNLSFENSKTKVTVETIKKILKNNARILDIGANTGDLLDFAQEKGCKTFGIEYSVNSFNLLKEKKHIAYSNIQEIKNSFDIITAFDIIEHFYNFPKLLDSCFDRLVPNGYLVILTGNIGCLSAKIAGANWWYVRFPEHIIFPSKKYFKQHTKFQLIDWINTYAGNGYKKPIFEMLKTTTKELLKAKYSGQHSFVADHALIVLKRKSLS